MKILINLIHKNILGLPSKSLVQKYFFLILLEINLKREPNPYLNQPPSKSSRKKAEKENYISTIQKILFIIDEKSFKLLYNGTWVDPDKVPKVIPEEEKKIEQVPLIEEQENTISCPNCQSTKKRVCQLLYFDQIILCSSERCQDKAFCIFCKKQVNLNDPPSHYNDYTKLCKFI